MSLAWLSLLEALCGFACGGPYVELSARLVAGGAAVAGWVGCPRRRALLLVAFGIGLVGAWRLGRLEGELPANTPAAFELAAPCRDGRARAWVRPEGAPPRRLLLSGLPDSLQSGARGFAILGGIEVVSRRNPDDADRRRSLLGRRVQGRAWVKRDSVVILSGGRLGPAQGIRAWLVRRWRREWGASSPLWEALVLGERRGLNAEVQGRMGRLGLAHLLALSGLHVGIVCALLLWPFRRWGRRGTVHLLPLIAAWAGLAGLSSSMLRAVGMVAWWAWGRRLGRPSRALDGLAVVAMAELVWRPVALLSVGWWLSYAATVGILHWGQGAAPSSRLVAAIRISVAAQLATLPWVLGLFGTFAWASPLSLLVIGPVFGGVLALGLVGILVESCGLGWPGIHMMVMVASHLFGASVALAARVMPEAWGHPGIGGGAWTAAMTAVSLVLPPWRGARFWRWTGALGLVLVVHAGGWDRGGAQWVSMDVGQGDAAVYRAGGRTLVVDAGPWSPAYDAGRSTVLPYLARRNLRGVDLLITHGHLDHFGGASALLNSGRVGRLIMAAADSTQAWARRLGSIAREEGAEVDWVEAGDRWKMGEWPVECWWPRGDASAKDANLRSIVVRVGSPSQGLLAPGDLEREAERALLESQLLGQASIRILKVAHHGGNTGTDAGWLRVLMPRDALVSCGRINRYGHPHSAVLQRLESARVRVWRTDEAGALRIEWDRGGAARVGSCR